MTFHETYHTQLARKLGLPAPFPTRWETCSDDDLDTYVQGLDAAIDNPDVTEDELGSLIMSINEHLGAKTRRHFDHFVDFYYRVPSFHPRSQLYYSLKKMAGSTVTGLDRMLEIYNTDHRGLKEYFQALFAKKGKQKHWDAIASTCTSQKDIDFLTMLAEAEKKKLDKHIVNPWIPDTPTTNEYPETTQEQQ